MYNRNGILIGRSSSGSNGNSTSPGVFNILEKKERHYSKTYNNAPDAEHAAAHLDRHRHALGPVAWLSGPATVASDCHMIFWRRFLMPLRKAVRW
jgi:hypothetical protein